VTSSLVDYLIKTCGDQPTSLPFALSASDQPPPSEGAHFLVMPETRLVYGAGWTPDATVTISVGEPPASATQYHVRTDEWGEWWTAVGSIAAGDLVTVTDGSTTKHHRVEALTLATDLLDLRTVSITGSATPARAVDVWLLPRDDGEILQRQVVAGIDGTWSARFDVAPDVVYDVWATIYDGDGDYTWMVTTTLGPEPVLETRLPTTYNTRDGWAAHLAGDVTGNGRADLLSYHPGKGRWWITSSRDLREAQTAHHLRHDQRVGGAPGRRRDRQRPRRAALLPPGQGPLVAHRVPRHGLRSAEAGGHLRHPRRVGGAPGRGRDRQRSRRSALVPPAAVTVVRVLAPCGRHLPGAAGVHHLRHHRRVGGAPGRRRVRQRPRRPALLPRRQGPLVGHPHRPRQTDLPAPSAVSRGATGTSPPCARDRRGDGRRASAAEPAHSISEPERRPS
jgi:hypothetical protein